MKRRSTYRRPARSIWWMHPVVLFTLLMTFGSMSVALGLRLTGIIP